jgi:hypothetical protein
MPSGYVMPHSMPPAPPAYRPTIWLRLRVWWKREELDAALADGADPTESPQLTLRAQQLVGSGKRAELATSIHALIDIADRRPHPLQATFRPSQVQANRSSLLELAERLRGQGPHALRGLAMTTRLIEDGRGPLYPDNGPRTLECAVHDAISGLETEPLRTDPVAEPAQLSRLAARMEELESEG